MPLSPMKTNDALLSRFIAFEEQRRQATLTEISDELLLSPRVIKVRNHEVVFIHFIKIKPAEFYLVLSTPTSIHRFTPNHGVRGQINQIIRSIGKVNIIFKEHIVFHLQLLRLRF